MGGMTREDLARLQMIDQQRRLHEEQQLRMQQQHYNPGSGRSSGGGGGGGGAQQGYGGGGPPPYADGGGNSVPMGGQGSAVPLSAKLATLRVESGIGAGGGSPRTHRRAGSLGGNETLEVLFDFDPTQQDEIRLDVGEMVT